MHFLTEYSLFSPSSLYDNSCFFLRWMETLRDHFVSTFRCRSSFYSLLLKLCCCYPVVHCQVLGMYFKELHTCLVNGALLRLLLVTHQLSHGNGHLDQDSRLCMFARLIVVRDPTGSDFDNKLLWVSVASFVSIPKVF